MKLPAFLLCLPALLFLASTPGSRQYRPPRIVALPTKPGNGLRSAQWSYWCSSVVRDSSGLYHMFASRFAKHCGLGSYTTNSEIVHAVATDPLGPFTERGLVVPADAHNATIFRDRDGSWLLFYFGMVIDSNSRACNCAAGESKWLAPYGRTLWGCYIEVRHAPTLDGPWSEPRRITHLLHLPPCATNPAPVLEADGSISLFYRAYHLSQKRHPPKDSTRVNIWPGEYIYRLKAKKWNGSYKAVSLHKVMDQPAEDPFVWKDRHGYYITFNNKFNDSYNLGGYAFSADGNHFEAQPPIYSRKVSYTDGSSELVDHRERPYIFWLTDSTGVLYTGTRPGKSSDKSYVLAVPVIKLAAEEQP